MTTRPGTQSSTRKGAKPETGGTEAVGIQTQRIDKWLWHARFARTRTPAQRLALSGHVRTNRKRVASASRSVKPGDVLTLAIGKTVHIVEVTSIAPRRGSPDAARKLYEDRTPKVDLPLQRAGRALVPSPDESGMCSEGRPDKHGRRRILALKRKQF